MNTTATEVSHGGEWSLRRLVSGSILESFGSMAVVVLAIVGLAGIDSNTLAAIATILVGATFLSQGGSLTRSGLIEDREMHEGVTAEFMAGVAGIVLGILALFGVYALVLLPAAVIVFGAALVLAGATASRLQWLLGMPARPNQENFDAALHDISSLSGSSFFAGLAAVVLGILGVIGLSPVVLTLVGLLSLGVAGIFSGTFTSRA